MPFTCKGCQEREPGCHSRCEKYKRESEIWEKEKARRRMEQEVRSYTRDAISKSTNAQAVRRKNSPGRKWYRYGQ